MVFSRIFAQSETQIVSTRNWTLVDDFISLAANLNIYAMYSILSDSQYNQTVVICARFSDFFLFNHTVKTYDYSPGSKYISHQTKLKNLIQPACFFICNSNNDIYQHYLRFHFPFIPSSVAKRPLIASHSDVDPIWVCIMTIIGSQSTKPLIGWTSRECNFNALYHGRTFSPFTGYRHYFRSSLLLSSVMLNIDISGKFIS